jgi:flagellar basal body-associated protein FliL
MMKNLVLLMLAVIAPVFIFAQDAAEKINQANEAMKAEDYAKAYQLYDEAMNNLGDVQVDQTINYNIGFAAYKAENDEGALKYFSYITPELEVPYIARSSRSVYIYIITS